MTKLQQLSYAEYQANIYQFCIDQFPDASTNAIKSFISWFIWTYATGCVAGLYICECIDKQYYVTGQCFISTCLTITLIMSFLLNSIFIKEPVVTNSYKLVYKVIKYALQNKHPQRRSAFLPTVKINFLLVWILPKVSTEVHSQQNRWKMLKRFYESWQSRHFAASYIPSELAFIVYKHSNKLILLISHHSNTTSVTECFVTVNISDLLFYCGIILIPVHELIIYPLLHRYFHRVNSTCKFLFGVVLQIIRIVALMLIEFEARHRYIRHYGSNMTMQCMFGKRMVPWILLLTDGGWPYRLS